MENQRVTDVIIGVGINVRIDDFPKELQQSAGNLFEEQPPFTRNQLITAIWKAFLETDEKELIALYKEKSLIVGQQVSFVENQVEFKGTAIAVTDTGNLVIQLDNGKAKLSPAEKSALLLGLLLHQTNKFSHLVSKMKIPIGDKGVDTCNQEISCQNRCIHKINS